MKERIKETTRLSEALPVSLKSQLAARSTRLSQLKMNWSSELPTNVHAKAQPYRIDNNTLEIYLRVDITPTEEKFIKRWFRDEAPRYGLKTIQFVSASESSAEGVNVPTESSPTARARTDFIEDEGLRHALSTLITHVERRGSRA